jgi:hypothetical protein
VSAGLLSGEWIVNQQVQLGVNTIQRLDATGRGVLRGEHHQCRAEHVRLEPRKEPCDLEEQRPKLRVVNVEIAVVGVYRLVSANLETAR